MRGALREAPCLALRSATPTAIPRRPITRAFRVGSGPRFTGSAGCRRNRGRSLERLRPARGHADAREREVAALALEQLHALFAASQGSVVFLPRPLLARALSLGVEWPRPWLSNSMAVGGVSQTAGGLGSGRIWGRPRVGAFHPRVSANRTPPTSLSRTTSPVGATYRTCADSTYFAPQSCRWRIASMTAGMPAGSVIAGEHENVPATCQPEVSHVQSVPVQLLLQPKHSGYVVKVSTPGRWRSSCRPFPAAHMTRRPPVRPNTTPGRETRQSLRSCRARATGPHPRHQRRAAVHGYTSRWSSVGRCNRLLQRETRSASSRP